MMSNGYFSDSFAQSTRAHQAPQAPTLLWQANPVSGAAVVDHLHRDLPDLVGDQPVARSAQHFAPDRAEPDPAGRLPGSVRKSPSAANLQSSDVWPISDQLDQAGSRRS